MSLARPYEGNVTLEDRLQTRQPSSGPAVDWLTPGSLDIVGGVRYHLNGWKEAGDPYDTVQFRRTEDGGVEFKGHLNAEEAVTDTVAFVLPAGYRPPMDVSFLTDILAGTEFSVARVAISATTGEVTITFPATL